MWHLAWDLILHADTCFFEQKSAIRAMVHAYSNSLGSTECSIRRACRVGKLINMLSRCADAGTVLVRFYGEHSSMWLKPEQLEQPSLDDEDKTSALRCWGRQHHKCALSLHLCSCMTQIKPCGSQATSDDRLQAGQLRVCKLPLKYQAASSQVSRPKPEQLKQPRLDEQNKAPALRCWACHDHRKPAGQRIGVMAYWRPCSQLLGYLLLCFYAGHP